MTVDRWDVAFVIWIDLENFRKFLVVLENQKKEKKF